MAGEVSIASLVFYPLAVGFLPVLAWLWFWLKEDPHPEPRRALFRAFTLGILAVPIGLVLEILVFDFAFGGAFQNTLVFWLILAGIEEVMKYEAASRAAFRSTNFDEPIDAPIYMITAALGFASAENAFFIANALFGQEAIFVTGGLRFFGATLIHIISSGAVGVFLAYAFYKKRNYARNLIFGLTAAILLHASFNFFIIKEGDGGILLVFGFVWLLALLLYLFFGKIKKIHK